MLNFNDYFMDSYQFSLKEVVYSKVDREDPLECELKISDTLTADVADKLLVLTFMRDVNFEPVSMFNLKVVFNIILTFKEDVKDDIKTINWSQALIENPNIYLGNVVSRVSHLIAEITASFGQQPLITPPNPISKDEVI